MQNKEGRKFYKICEYIGNDKIYKSAAKKKIDWAEYLTILRIRRNIIGVTIFWFIATLCDVYILLKNYYLDVHFRLKWQKNYF